MDDRRRLRDRWPLVLLVLAPACRTPPAAAPAPSVKTLTVTGAGTALERLTSEEVDELHPSISPDGTRLLFEIDTRSRTAEDHLSKQTLVSINPVTRAQRTLLTADSSHSAQPAWLPDGSSFVYASDAPGGWSLVRALTAAPNAAVSVIASGEIAPRASWPTISPDGRRVAFTTVVHRTVQIAVIDIDGSRFTLLGPGMAPSWSPDGARLAFTRRVGKHFQLFLVEPTTGTDVVQLTTDEHENTEPSWSPDAQYIVFSTTRGWKKEEGRRAAHSNEPLHPQSRRDRAHAAHVG